MNILNILIDVFLSTDSFHIQSDVLWCMINLTENNVNVFNTIIDNNNFNQYMLAVLKNKIDDKITNMILSFYYNGINNGNSISIWRLLDIGLIKVIMDMIKLGLKQTLMMLAIGILNKIISPELAQRDE